MTKAGESAHVGETPSQPDAGHLHMEQFFTPGPGPFWKRLPGPSAARSLNIGDAIVLTRFDDCRSILMDRRFLDWTLKKLSRTPGMDPRFIERRRRSILSMEGPDHQRLRRLALPHLSSDAMALRRRHVREVMARNFEAVASVKSCEAVQTLCRPLPIPVICRLLGAPEQDLEFISETAAAWTRWMSGDPAAIPGALNAHDDMDAYMRALLERAREGGLAADSLIATLMTAEANGEKLTASEIGFIAASLIIAGTDTVRFALANALVLFAEHPQFWARLAEQPELCAGAVEEVLRFAPVFPGLDRYAECDVELGDLHLPAGARVTLSLISANRDERHFPNPDCFDIRRAFEVGHLSFGGGRHFCLGAHLARIELQEALAFLAPRMPNLRILDNTLWMGPTLFQGPSRLNIAWD